MVCLVKNLCRVVNVVCLVQNLGEWMDGWMDGRKDGWKDGRKEGRESGVKDCLQQSIKCQIEWMDVKAGLQQSKYLVTASMGE